jgi:hypothetical protein
MDISATFGGDLELAPNGSLKLVDGLLRGQQRVIRRLMTILGEYIWHIDYGASVPRRVGDTLDTTLIESVIRSQIHLEAVVAPSPVPAITVEPIPSGVLVRIAYADASSGQQLELAFEVEL